MPHPELASLAAEARRQLLLARGPAGHWVGHLSDSALSTATALFALHLHDPAGHRALIEAGLRWLVDHQNEDGGWGDTVLSLSNISTTALCWAALTVPSPVDVSAAAARCEMYLSRAAGSLKAADLAAAIARRYGKDRTFSVPILTMCALAGRLGPAREAFALIPQLPFELAACPHGWFKFLRLPVVSYALPALIAMGLVRHVQRPSWNPVASALRRALRPRVLRVLRSIQPTSGGFLEATPLTSFVAMSLIAAGQRDHEVVRHGVEFLVASARADGAWPIDTNLATWVTTLSVNALCADGKPWLEHADLDAGSRDAILEWLLAQQYREEHPYTHAAPGGWAWTDLSGGVPDADDTPGALLALHHLAPDDPRCIAAARRGVTWLLDLQNRDGGMPTFCRGWTNLPFDRSGADLTAHALLACRAWYDRLPELHGRIDSAMARAVGYLARVQRPDGSWLPLWFGNQRNPRDENPIYGTARVVIALAGELPGVPPVSAPAEGTATGDGPSRSPGCTSGASSEPGVSGHSVPPVGTPAALVSGAIQFLLSSQNPDGSFGASIEETALAIHALAASGDPRCADAIDRAIAWLGARTDSGHRFDPAPIGFYFANLWYFEKLYPLIFATAAVAACQAQRPPR